MLPKNHAEYSLGKLSTLSYSDIEEGKLSCETCTDCLESGLAFWINNPSLPNFINDYNDFFIERQELTKKDKEIQERERTINSLLNSRVNRLHRALAHPLVYIQKRLYGNQRS